ncbi:hypothetical protein CYY_009222 [Polysphondylium violaceum]|uniref:MRH domain-containing protein n=1 Tax=Polysphondylium violaceum TaxID=133409 RepID=A0A8J4PM30_9MYCE|nr:hypothetical protein CYY_009222 [Polysphondylium violaceum]
MKLILTLFISIFLVNVLTVFGQNVQYAEYRIYDASDSSCSNNPLWIDGMLSGTESHAIMLTCSADGITVDVTTWEGTQTIPTGLCMVFNSQNANFACASSPTVLKNSLALYQYDGCDPTIGQVATYQLASVNQCATSLIYPTVTTYLTCTPENSVEYFFDTTLPSNSTDQFCPGGLTDKNVQYWTNGECVNGSAQVFECNN